MKLTKIIIIKKIVLLALCLSTHAQDMYFATACDDTYFEQAVNLIATLHRYNFYHIKKIAVFNLGLSPEHIQFLNSLAKVQVFEVEKVNPDMLTHFVVRGGRKEAGRTARGWYTWKPVILKQALDMFPSVIYIDAGISVTEPMTNLYKYLEQYGYFLIDCGHNIRQMTVKNVIEFFELNKPENVWILDAPGAAAGFIGLTRELLDPIVLPLYNLAHDIHYFADDGTGSFGFGWGRPEQSILSILAHISRLNIFYCLRRYKVTVDNHQMVFNPFSYIALTRNAINLAEAKKHIVYKPFATKSKGGHVIKPQTKATLNALVAQHHKKHGAVKGFKKSGNKLKYLLKENL